jgi:hypothetical protein
MKLLPVWAIKMNNRIIIHFHTIPAKHNDRLFYSTNLIGGELNLQCFQRSDIRDFYPMEFTSSSLASRFILWKINAKSKCNNVTEALSFPGQTIWLKCPLSENNGKSGVAR